MSDKFSKLDPPEPPFFMKLILSVVLFVLCGVAIMLMWNWFVVALGLPSIGLAHAMGIDLLISFIVTTRISMDADPFLLRWVVGMLYALCTILIGFVLHLLI